MKKSLFVITITLFISFILTGCKCDHIWQEATCSTPKTCSACGETEGEVNSHDWASATCKQPKNCKLCGTTEGEPIEHIWEDATCTAPKTCYQCGETEGRALGHNAVWVITEAPTITDDGLEEYICSICDETLIEQKIAKKSAEVAGTSFNFTDDEFIDWINDISSMSVSYTDLSDGDYGDNTLYRCTFDGEVGGFYLNHGDNGKYGNICAIMVWFDDYMDSLPIAAWIGEKINPAFSYDDACNKVLAGSSYTNADMTIMEVDGFMVLAPSEFFAELLS